MAELKDQFKKLEKDIKALVANQKSWKEMKNNNAVLKKEIKDEVVLVL